MPVTFIKPISLLLMLCLYFSSTKAVNDERCDRLCGKWMSSEKNLIVLIYKEGDDFKAKVVWFNDEMVKTNPIETRLDNNNPNKALRSRKIIGMNVLEGLKYVAKTDSWEEGKIYDARSGHIWDSAAYINKNGELKVSGYWHFKFLGKTMTFYRV